MQLSKTATMALLNDLSTTMNKAESARYLMHLGMTDAELLNFGFEKHILLAARVLHGRKEQPVVSVSWWPQA